MELRKLVQALLRGDLLTARQCVADAQRARVQWSDVVAPAGLSEQEIAVAAAVVELLASRAGEQAPHWTASVGPVLELLVLDPGLDQMPRSFARAKASGPAPLLRRNIVAMPDFLIVA